MLDAKTLRSVLVAAQEAEDTRAFIADEDVRAAVAAALVKASGLEAIDLARIGLEPEDIQDIPVYQYFQLAALCYQGGAYTKTFKAALRAKKVVLVGGGMPPGWHDSLEEYIHEVDVDEALSLAEDPEQQFIIGTDVDGDEEDDLRTMGVKSISPLSATLGLVRESNPTLQQLAGLCLAFEGKFAGPEVTLRRGFKELVVKLGKNTVTVDGKALASRVYLANEFSGDPSADLPAIKAVYWALLYALAGTRGDQVTGRMAFLTGLFAEVDDTAEVEGRAQHKYAGKPGVLSLSLDVPTGIIAVKNGEGATNVQALETALLAGIAAFPQHQLTSIQVGEGANAVGVGLNGNTVLTDAQCDKTEKIANRVSSSVKKGVHQVGGSVESAFKVIIRK